MAGSSLDDLTPIQREAVEATAAAHLRNAEDLAVELLPLLYIDPAAEIEPTGWSALDAVDEAPSGVVFRVLPPVPTTVKKSLTPTAPLEATR